MILSRISLILTRWIIEDWKFPGWNIPYTPNEVWGKNSYGLPQNELGEYLKKSFSQGSGGKTKNT